LSEPLTDSSAGLKVGLSKEGSSTGASDQGAEQNNELTKKIQELEAKLKDSENKYLYLYAEFENYKKRTIKERSDLVKFGWENTARDLLSIADNLERALSHIPANTDKNLADGLKMILSQFWSTLQKQGVQTVESVGKPFDPELHEAIGQEPSDLPAGSITQEHQKGYLLYGRLLRPARVMVSMGKNEPAEK
jgi:molecular chaperone GrpE